MKSLVKIPSPWGRRGSLAAAGLWACLSAAGCSEEPAGAADKIVYRSPASFTDQPGELVGPLEVQVLSPPVRGVPGRSGYRDPVPKAPVRFKVMDAPEPSRGPLLSKTDSTPVVESEATVVSDAQGEARVWVRLPRAIGQWRVRAGVRDQIEKDETISFVVASGMKVRLTGEESSVGRKVQVAVQVFKLDTGGNPVPDDRRQVMFRIPDGPLGIDARLAADKLADRKPTNSEGVASVELTLGRRSGIYHVTAEPWSNPLEEPQAMSPVVLNGVAVDWTQATLEILGGSLLFLVGLRLLGHGILNRLGPALALPVTHFQRGRLGGFTGGVAAGAILQSSTSVTSRLVSFANGGLLTAAGAMGVVLGADLGRTVLPQVLAFPIDEAAVPLLALGGLGLFLPRRLGLYAWGWIFLGAGLVVLGSWLLSLGADILQLSPSLRAHLVDWDYTSARLSQGGKLWLFATTMASSAAVAFVLRNSNLPVVAAMALGEAGLITPTVALPIVLGANLGPALSLSLAMVGRRLEARRIALVQLFFQLVGAAWFIVPCLITVGKTPLFLHLVDWITPGLLFHPQPEHVAHHMAMTHTLYNLLNGVICLALAGPILNLAVRAAPRDPIRDDVKPYHLDPNLIETPALAILQASREVTYLAELCQKAIAESFDAFRYRDLKLADQTVRREETIDSVHRDLSQYLLRVGENDLSLRESSRLQILQATTGSLVRIGELGERLRDLTARELDEGVDIPEDVARDLNEIYDLVMGQFENVLQLLDRPEGRTSENAVKATERLAKFESRVEQTWYEKLRLWDQNGAGALAATRAEPAPEAGAPAEPAAAPAEPAAKGVRTEVGTERVLVRTLIHRDALETLFRAAGHLSHIAVRMRVLSPQASGN